MDVGRREDLFFWSSPIISVETCKQEIPPPSFQISEHAPAIGAEDMGLDSRDGQIGTVLPTARHHSGLPWWEEPGGLGSLVPKKKTVCKGGPGGGAITIG